MTSRERHENRYRRRKARREEKKKQLDMYKDFEPIFTYDRLYQSYRQCRKNVRWKASIQRFIANDVLNIYDIWNGLRNGTFRMKPMHSFDIMERGKPRHIQSVCIRDRVVQRCLCDYSLVPLLTRRFIYDNSACIKGKGYHFAIRRLCENLRKHYRKHGNTGYILLFDFKKYFENISHDKAKKLIQDVVDDERILNVADQIIDRFDGKMGLGLGSQVSQILAMAAGNELDHYIKDRCGIKGYGRYNDDGYIIHESKEYLKKLLNEIREVCGKNGIQINEKKTQIVKISHGFTWLKVKINQTDSGRIVKRISHGSVVKERRKLKKLKRMVRERKITRFDVYQSFQSWRAYAEKLRAWRSIQSISALYNQLYVYDMEEEEMKTTVQLESKDVREMIAKFLNIPQEDVIPNRYSFSVANMSAEEIEARIKSNEGGE